VADTRTKGTESRGRRRRGPLAFVPLQSKLHVPTSRPGLIARPHLLERLRAARSSPLTLMVAPPGYGKTTLATQWSEDDERPFVWVTLDGGDNDPSMLLAYIVFALNEVVSLDAGIFPRTPEPGPAFVAFALPRIASALAQRAIPFVLVLDDVHVVQDPDSLDLLALLAQNMPTDSQLVLIGREMPRLPLSRLLVGRSVVTIGMRQLAMSGREAVRLLHAAALPVNDAEAAVLAERTEGWPAGLYLAALALREQEHLGEALESFAGSDQLLMDYVRTELLEHLPPNQLRFMLGTAALERLCGPLCDAVLGRRGSTAKLEELERLNLFVMPTNRNRVWFRRHQLFAEILLAELRRVAPKQEAVQHRRAAEWFADHGDVEQALDHAHAANDIEYAARLIATNAATYISTGRASRIRRWIESLPSTALANLPWFGAAAATAYVPSGNIDRATHWLAVAERGDPDAGPLPDGRVSQRSAIMTTRAAIGLGDLASIRRDASEAYELERDDSVWKSFCAMVSGGTAYLMGDRADGIERLEAAVRLSALDSPSIHAWSLALLALAAGDTEDWEGLRTFAERARIEVERNALQEYGSASLVYGASALSCGHWHQPAEARRDAVTATRLLATLSPLAPWMAIQVRAATASAYVLLGDPAQAREMLRPAQRDLFRFHDSPVVVERLEKLRVAIAQQRSATAGPPLTAAEIRVLQFLPTHLSFREIAERLHVSRNTVKTQVISSYRKLGAASRTEAVEVAARLGVIEGPADVPPTLDDVLDVTDR
jgi:LuxR family maltose regulon positive regulatory protein